MERLMPGTNPRSLRKETGQKTESNGKTGNPASRQRAGGVETGPRRGGA